jgi:hypothetical protein
MSIDEIVERVASDYHLPGPTNLREAIRRGIDAALREAQKEAVHD